MLLLFTHGHPKVAPGSFHDECVHGREANAHTIAKILGEARSLEGKYREHVMFPGLFVHVVRLVGD
jgi:hypothetical protein